MLAFEDNEEDESITGGMYDGGHWVWDDNAEALVFISDILPAAVEINAMTTKTPTGTIEFRDDIDVLEQDIKDLAIFMAPTYILSPSLIHMLHLPTSDRFFRTLIFYCQYYLQVADEMATRMNELKTKMRTPQCDVIEDEHRTNLSDLRALVGKEYSILLIGGGEFRRFHHMGPEKKSKSLSHNGARLFEIFMRFSVQIVWLALERKSYNQIELELNRIFKSDTFNSSEHSLKIDCLSTKTPEGRSVLLGNCLRREKKLTTRSPLLNEVFCNRTMDYRMFTLGIMKFHHSIASTSSVKSSKSTKSTGLVAPLFPDIQLPPKCDTVPVPETYPCEAVIVAPCSVAQRQRWQRRLQRLRHPVTRSQCSRLQASEVVVPSSCLINATIAATPDH